MITTESIATFFLIIFTFVATIDGLYFHLYKYQLYKRPESIKEHYLHTQNAFLFPFTIALLFVINVSGALLWLAIGLTLITLIIEFLDVFEEKKSRQQLGGLTSLEYAMHFAMSGLRATYTSLICASKPLSAWALTSPLTLSTSYPLWIQITGTSVVILGIPIFIVHYCLWRWCEKTV